MNEDTKTFVFGDNANNGMVPAWMAYGNNNGWGNGFGGSNFWGAGIGGFLGSALGNLINGNGLGIGNNGGAAAASLGAQATANANAELLRSAIASTGEQSIQAIQTISNMIGQDFATTSSQISAINGILSNMAIQNATTPLQIMNSIISGNKDLAATFASCCCENKLLVTSQGYENQIATLNQTNALSSQADRNANDIIRAINAQTVEMDNQFCAARERDMQAKIDTQADIITQLRGQVDNAQQTAAITGYINSLIAPLQAKVTQIADKQLPTVPVQWPQIQAVNMTPYAGNYYGGGFYGNGWNNGLYF